MRSFLLALCATVCTACVSLSEERPVNGRYLGFVEVVSEPSDTTDAPVIRRRVRTFGGWLEGRPGSNAIGGAGLGWRDSATVIVPRACHVVIIVRNDAELASAKAWAEDGKRRELCIVRDLD